jgi:hypothetical protein
MSKAAASRWFASHVGHMVETIQTDPVGNVKWVPGARKLSAHGSTGFKLDDSHVGMDQRGMHFEMNEHGPVLHWHDEDGLPIHSTQYKVADQMHPTPQHQHLLAVHGNQGMVVLPSKQAGQ